MIAKNSEEWNIFKRTWDLYKKYHEPDGDIEEHIDKMIRELGDFGQEHVGTNNEILVKGFIVAIADDFAFRHKRGAFK